MASNSLININEIKDFSEDIDNSLPDLSKSSGGDITTAMWGMSTALIQEISNMNKVYSSKHGLFASVPIICKNQDCVYKNVCMVSPSQRIVGHRCPMEISAIMSRYELWCRHFGLDTSIDVIDTKDLVDATLIKDLVNVEIQMIRAENKIALSGDFMADTLLDIDKKCKPYFGKDISPEVSFLMTLQDKKIKILNQLNATRKDKASDKRKDSASTAALEIFQKMKEMEHNKNIINISDVIFDETDNTNVIKIDEPTPVEEEI